ncbi:MAG: [LysW]-lysine hydrolase [Candidatus Dormibacteraeota bacterium]|nr:[LysW]-lysine hydrolase [Candidatus Dormibacteraeota bacterium]
MSGASMRAPEATLAADSIEPLDGEQLLRDMVAVPSPSGGEGALTSMLQRRLSAAGFDAHIDAVGNVIASWGTGGETIALVGHVDTAPGNIPMRRDGDSLYGRGTVDAKGPLAAACTAVSRLPRDRGRRYVVVGAVEEEATSRGARHLAATMVAPDALVILEPSGWEGVTIAYKGSVRLRWERSQPTGHGAGPLPSAGDHAMSFVRRLQDDAAIWSGEGGIFDRLDVRVLRLTAGSDGFVDRATVEIGLRVPPRCDFETLRATLDDLSVDGELTVDYADAAVRTDRSSPLARSFIRAIREHGGAPRFKLKTGTSDLNVLAPVWRCPAVAYGPGNSRLDHTPDEHVELDDFHRAVSVLEAALRP